MNQESDGKIGLKPLQRTLVLATAVLCGAVVMEVEILGARIVGPMFGVSLFVWTALITVTLLALTTGYFFGGRLADRSPSLRTLGFLVGLAGLFLLLLPLLRGPVLLMASEFSVRTGALVAALLLFGPALMLLGAVTPFAVKLFLLDTKQTGRTVGRLSALSTLGSFVGTVATGFWLVPLFHVNQLVAGTSMVLLVLSASLLTGAGQWAAGAAILPALFFLQPPLLASVMQANGTKATLVHRKGSFYGHIDVVDYTFPPRHMRELLVDGIIQGAVDMTDGRSIHAFCYFQEQAGLTARPDARRVLVIGLGAGIVPRHLSRRGMEGVSVEIDPAMARVARDWFGYEPSGRFPLALEDGRHFLVHDRGSYDLAFLDVFTAENEPAHMLTKECFELVSARLSPGGALVINFSGLAPGHGVENRSLDTLFRTLASVFPKVRSYRNPAVAAGQVVNFTLVGQRDGGAGGLPVPVFEPVHPICLNELDGFLNTDYRPASLEGPIYTDDWCPLEADSAPVKLLLRRVAMRYTPAEILLN